VESTISYFPGGFRLPSKLLSFVMYPMDQLNFQIRRVFRSLRRTRARSVHVSSRVPLRLVRLFLPPSVPLLSTRTLFHVARSEDFLLFTRGAFSSSSLLISSTCAIALDEARSSDRRGTTTNDQGEKGGESPFEPGSSPGSKRDESGQKGKAEGIEDELDGSTRGIPCKNGV